MADHDHGARIIGQMVLKPQRAFEVEIVGRLVQQQQVGRRKQRRRERHAHAPAAGEFRAGPRLIGGGKSEAAEDRAPHGPAPEWASMSTSRVWISAMRCGSCGGLRFAQQRVALKIGLQHDVDQAFRAVRRLLREAADAPAWRRG